MDPAPCTVTLWHASGVDVPRELLAALSGPGSKTNAGGIKIKAVGDPFLALASLCRITREERQKRGEIDGPTSARLVIVYPELLTDAAELCAAADAYAPGVPRWQYGPAANPTLRPIVEQDVARWGSREATPQVVIVPEAVRNADPRPKTSRTMPQLRLAGEGPEGGPTGGGSSALDNHPNPVDAQGPTRLAGGPAEGSAPRSEPPAPLITDEELRMLLGEE